MTGIQRPAAAGTDGTAGATAPALGLVFYAGPALPLSVLMFPLIIYVPTYYATELGLSLAAIGLIAAASRIWDGVIDVVIGTASDHTRTRWGKRKPWIVLGTPLLIYATYRLCMPPPDAGMTYLTTWFFLLYFALALVQIPYLSWGAGLADDYRGRTRVVAFREIGTVIGSLGAMALPLILLGGRELALSDTLKAYVWAIAILLPVTVLLAAAFTPAEPERSAMGKGPWHRGLRAVLRNTLFLRFMAADFLVVTAFAAFSATQLLYVSQALGLGAHFSEFLVVMYCGIILLAPLAVKAATRFGKHRTMCGGIVVMSIFLLVLLLLPAGHRWLTFTLFLAVGISYAAILVTPASIVADTVDFGRLKGGGDDNGLYFSLYNLVKKVAMASGVGLAFPLLDGIGFDARGGNDAEALVGLRLVTCLLPILVFVPAVALLWRYPMDSRRHAIVRRWLARRS